MTRTELARLTKDELLKEVKKAKVKASDAMTKTEIIDLLAEKPKAAPAKKASEKKPVATTKAVKTAAAKKTLPAKTAAEPAAKKPAAAQKTAARTPVKKAAPAARKKPSNEGMNDIVRGESKKFEIEDYRGYSEPAYHLASEKSYELPESYGETRLTLLVQDPYWIHAYWEISEDARKKAGIPRGRHEKDVVIRVYHADTDDFFDIHINDTAKSWYFNVPHPNRPYFSEIGILEHDGHFLAMARSNPIFVPNDRAAEPDRHKPEEVVIEELFRQSGGYIIHKLVGSQIVTEWMAGPVMSSSGPNSSHVSSFGSAHITSGSGIGIPTPARKRGFWAELHTELIVYGATEPDAKCTLGGKPLKLTPDGKFSIRFYLKDGDHSVPFVAESADGIDTIEIAPHASKRTIRKEHSRE